MAPVDIEAVRPEDAIGNSGFILDRHEQHALSHVNAVLDLHQIFFDEVSACNRSDKLRGDLTIKSYCRLAHPILGRVLAAKNASSKAIHVASEGVRWLAERASGRPVVYVPGNHEWYARLLPEEAEKAKSLATELGIHFLMDAAVTIGDVRFLGATLWTDYELMAPSPLSVERGEGATCLNDHQLIDIRPGERFQPADALEFHQASRAWLARELSAKPSYIRKTVVITHHLPHPRSIDPRYDGDALNPAFASRMTDLVEASGADLWIHGHTHSSCDYVAGGCRVVANPKGYGPRRPGGPVENSRFDPMLVVEI